MRNLLLTIALLASAGAFAAEHKIVFQVNENDPQTMNIALNNAANMNKYYMDKGEEAQIEIVTYGPGLNMFNAAKSPVADRIKSFQQNFDNIGLRACGNTMAKIKRKTGKDVPLLPGVEVVPSGVVYLVQREEDGWSYIKP
jgi:uncharacterized protein